MRIFLSLTVGISLIILAGGTIAYIENPTFGGSLILAAAWVAMAVITIVALVFAFESENKKRNRSTKNNNLSEKLTKRVKELEKRLIDLQDIVITNDDKLERLENKSLVYATFTSANHLGMTDNLRNKKDIPCWQNSSASHSSSPAAIFAFPGSLPAHRLSIWSLLFLLLKLAIAVGYVLGSVIA